MNAINDKETSRMLKSNLNLTPLDIKTQAPIILGTVTGGWTRKLKMMQASLYSFLSVQDKEEITWNNREACKQVRDRVIKVINTRNLSSLYSEQTQGQSLDFQASLSGWKKVLNDKVLNNKETDVVSINMPLGEQVCKDDCCFVFAGFLPTGHHQFLIYDVKSD